MKPPQKSSFTYSTAIHSATDLLELRGDLECHLSVLRSDMLNIEAEMTTLGSLTASTMNRLDASQDEKQRQALAAAVVAEQKELRIHGVDMYVKALKMEDLLDKYANASDSAMNYLQSHLVTQRGARQEAERARKAKEWVRRKIELATKTEERDRGDKYLFDRLAQRDRDLDAHAEEMKERIRQANSGMGDADLSAAMASLAAFRKYQTTQDGGEQRFQQMQDLDTQYDSDKAEELAHRAGKTKELVQVCTSFCNSLTEKPAQNNKERAEEDRMLAELAEFLNKEVERRTHPEEDHVLRKNKQALEAIDMKIEEERERLEALEVSMLNLLRSGDV